MTTKKKLAKATKQQSANKALLSAQNQGGREKVGFTVIKKPDNPANRFLLTCKRPEPSVSTGLSNAELSTNLM